LDVQHADSRGTRIRRHKLAIFEEGSGVGKSEERRRGGGEKDDGVWPSRRTLLIERKRCVGGQASCWLGFALNKRRSELSNVRKVLSHV
jgi:hypothetical protein